MFILRIYGNPQIHLVKYAALLKHVVHIVTTILQT
jgi:hypothetical protein